MNIFSMNIQFSEYLPTSKTVRNRIPKRRHSRRWQKKFIKKYGFRTVKINPILRLGNTLVMSRETFGLVEKGLVKM